MNSCACGDAERPCHGRAVELLRYGRESSGYPRPHPRHRCDKLATNLIDEGQFGAPIILTAFNYAQGRVVGVEMTARYDYGPWSLYGNLAWSRGMGKNITSAQFNFEPDELS